MEFIVLGNGQIDVVHPDYLKQGVPELMKDLTTINSCGPIFLVAACRAAGKPITAYEALDAEKEIPFLDYCAVSAKRATRCRMRIAKDYLRAPKGGPADKFRAMIHPTCAADLG